MPPIECKENIMKKEFYDEVTEIYDCTPRNTIRIVTGDFNAKMGRETSFRLHSVHEQSNNNGQRVVVFTTLRNTIISSTFFPRKDIHKCTWK